MELGPQNHNGDGLSGANSIMVVYMDPLGLEQKTLTMMLQGHEGNYLEVEVEGVEGLGV